MSFENLWDVVVLAVTLLAAGGLAILVLSPLVFDVPPPGLARARPVILGLVAAALVLLVVEFVLIH